MSIEQKIAELLEESKKAQEVAATLEEAVGEDEKEIVEEPAKEEISISEEEIIDESKKKSMKEEDDEEDDDDDDDEEEMKKDDEDEDEEDDKKDAKDMKKSPIEMKKGMKEEAETEQEITVDVSDDVKALLNGEELSEEFQAKAKTIFETVVVSRVKSEVARVTEELKAENEKSLEAIKEGLVEKVDGYLNYVVEQWIEQNEIALESGMKNEILENFVGGLKNLFEEHYIDIPEEKFDVLGDLQEQVNTLTNKLNEQTEANVKLSGTINDMKRSEIVAEQSANMTETDAEKFKGLVEDLSYEDAESFAKKVKTIRENYFAKKATSVNVNSVVTDEPVQIHEEKYADPTMKKYAEMLNHSRKS